MSTTWKRTLLIGAASLALAPFASAADGFRATPAYETDQGHGSDQRADDVYRVKAITADLAEAAEQAHRTAEHTARYTGRYGKAEIVRRLHDLAECSASFEDEVYQNAHTPYRLRDDYQLLLSTYRQAAYSLEHGHTSPRVERAFERVSELIYDLRYAWDDAYGKDWRGAGHHGDDRYRGDDRAEYRVDIRLRWPTWPFKRR